MAAKKTETETETQKISKIEFFNDDENEDFHGEYTDKNAIEAEILAEVKTKPNETEEFYSDEFALFLSSLPNDTEASFIVSRLPDRNLKGEFRLPCNVHRRIDVFYWNGESSPDDFYNQITEKHGGGKYNFQIREGKGFGRAWTQVLSDPPFLTEIEKALKSEKEETKQSEQPRNSESSQNFVSNAPPPMTAKTAIKDFLEQAKEFKELSQLFAPPQVQPETAAQPTVAQATKESIKMLLIEKSLGNERLLEKALESVFNIAPAERDEEPQGFWGTIAQAFAANPVLQDKLGDVISGTVEGASGLISGLIMPRQPPAIPNLPINLNSIRAPKNDAQGAPQPETQPQTQETAQNELLVITPSLKLED